MATIFPDTIKRDYQIGGKLDSIDVFTGFQSSTLPGGGWNLLGNTLEPTNFFKFQGGQRFCSFQPWKNIRFSGLPHIGFAYSFGTKGSQYVQTEYQQAFKKGALLNIDYTKNVSNGFLRNGAFSHNDLQVQFLKSGKIYSFEFKGSFESSDVTMNGGLLIDSLANDFPLIFLPVQKENAKLKTTRIRLYQSNYLDFNRDSLAAFGLFTQHDLKINKHVYAEEDTLFGIYNVVNFDSLSTYDQHQWSQVSSGAGVFLKSKFQFLKAGFDFKFWNFQNLGLYRDTVEISVFGKYQFNKNNFKVTNEFEVNIIAAQNELSNNFNFSLVRSKINYSGQIIFENKLPDYHQRFAFGNNYNPPTNDISKQKRLISSVLISGSLGPIDISGSYVYTMLRDNYFFIQDGWRNDTLQNIQFHQIKIRLNYKLGVLYVQPNYIFTVSDQMLKIIPTHQFQARIFIKGGLFKAKKMKAYAGVDCAFQSYNQLYGFSSSTASFQLDGPIIYNSNLFNLHFFTGFQIDEFKFFVRYENIGYLWNDHNIVSVHNFPIPSGFIKLGITWDFLN